MVTAPERSAENSEVAEVNGNSSKAAIVGFGEPEYNRLGTIFTKPELVNWLSLKEPSTTCHKGLDVYVARVCDCVLRN
jgi:hypothetical protein